MGKYAIAFFLGLLSFLVLMFVGETVGAAAGFIGLAVYLFACQFLLSRGNPDAAPGDWPLMLLLNAVMLVALVLMTLVERRAVVLSQGPAMLGACLTGTLGGAFAASRAARRKMATGR